MECTQCGKQFSSSYDITSLFYVEECWHLFCVGCVWKHINEKFIDTGSLMSLPAAKGVEIGSGFAGTRMTGLEHNDPFEPATDGTIRTTTNNSGGIQGGISNGEDVIVRVAFKPTGTISSEQKTVTRDGEATTLAARGRHDPCVLPRAVPMVEAQMLLVLADHWLRQRAIDVLPPLPELP